MESEDILAWRLILSRGNLSQKTQMSLAQVNSQLRTLVERQSGQVIRRLEALSNESNIRTEFSTLQTVNPRGFLFAQTVYKCLSDRRRSLAEVPYHVTERIIVKEYAAVVKDGMMVNIPMPFRNETTILEAVNQPTLLGRDAYHWSKSYGHQDYMVGCGPNANQAFVIRIHSGRFTPFFFLPESWEVHAQNVEWNRNIIIIQFVRMYSTHLENRYMVFGESDFPVQPFDILIIDAERWIGSPLNVAFYIRHLIWPSMWKELHNQEDILPNDFSVQGGRPYRDLLMIPDVVEIRPVPKSEKVATVEGKYIPGGCTFWLEIDGSNDHAVIRMITRIAFKPEEAGTLPTRRVHLMNPHLLIVRDFQGELLHEFTFES